MQEEALFEAKKCLSRLEKGVSLILLKSLPKPLRGRGCITQKPIFYSTNSLPKPLFIFAVKEKEQKFSLSSINFYLCCCKEKLTARGIN